MSEDAVHHQRNVSPTPIPADLIADGLLWLINTVVFHPRGFAVGITSSPAEPASGS